MKNSETSISDLSPAEKIQLVEDLWDEIASNPNDVPVHQWQKDELNRRKERLSKYPETALNWEQIKQNIRNRNVD